MSTSQILSLLKAFLSTRNATEFGRQLANLSKAEPDKWITLLHLNNILPEPKDNGFVPELQFWFEALQTTLTIDEFDPNNYNKLVLPLLTLQQCFASIRNRLEKLDVWETPGVKVVYRAAAFLEDQFQIAFNGMLQESKRRGYSGIDLLIGDNIPAMWGGANTNRVAGYEENCENLQLIVAFALYKYRGDFFGDVTNCKTPYFDAEFAKLLSMSTLWRRYEYLWGNIVYLGWQSIPHPDDKNIRLYVPKDKDEYLRTEVAGIRMQEIWSALALGTSTDTPERLEKLADSLTTPLAGETWDGAIDKNTLLISIEKISDDIYSIFELQKQHYGSFIDEIKLGTERSTISWRTYSKAMAILRVLSDVIVLKIRRHLSDTNADEATRKIWAVSKTTITSLFSEIIGLDLQQSSAVIDFLMFKPGYRHIEIWDTPLIEIDNERVLLVPALIRMGSPSRAMENFVAQWSPDLFKKRGFTLERSLEAFLKAKSIPVQASSFKLPDGTQLECDLVVYWDGYLIFIEAKCTKAIFGAADMFRAREKIEEAVEQLTHRREMALSYWTQFQSAFADLQLPSIPLGRSRIKLIAVTNVLHFTGWATKDVVVTDESCFARFFGDPEIKVITRNAVGVSVAGSAGRIRKFAKPTARELFDYLQNPPQVKIIRDCLEPQFIWYPSITKTDPKLGVFHAAYNAKKNVTGIATRKLIGFSKRRKRSQKK